MKKIILLALLILGSASAAFAATAITSTGTSIGSTSYMPSQGVTLYATSTITSYSVASKHVAGDVIYSGNNVGATISSTAGTKGTPLSSSLTGL